MRTIVLSSSSLDILTECPRKFFFTKVLQRTTQEKAKYFAEGEFLHGILDIYYKQKKSLNLDINKVIEESRFLATKSSLAISETEDIIKLFLEYHSFHSNDPWEIQGSEEPFAKVLWEDEKFDLRIIFQGKIDLQIRTHGIDTNVDHKKINQNREPNPRNNQILGYSWATDRRDFIINQLGTQKTLGPEKKFQRHYFNIQGHQIDEWVESTIYACFEAVKFHENSYFPPRITSCTDKFGKKCIFNPVCQLPSESWESYLESNYRKSEDHDLMGDE